MDRFAFSTVSRLIGVDDNVIDLGVETTCSKSFDSLCNGKCLSHSAKSSMHNQSTRLLNHSCNVGIYAQQQALRAHPWISKEPPMGSHTLAVDSVNKGCQPHLTAHIFQTRNRTLSVTCLRDSDSLQTWGTFWPVMYIRSQITSCQSESTGQTTALDDNQHSPSRTRTF